jgi:PAS domain S-box-containing protein
MTADELNSYITLATGFGVLAAGFIAWRKKSWVAAVAWWKQRLATREDYAALPGQLRDWREEADKDRGRYTGQFVALHEKFDQQAASMSDQNEALKGLKDALDTTLSMSLATFETSPVAGFVCDADGLNIIVNRSMCKLFGVDREELMGRKWQRFIAPDQLASYLARFNEAQAGHYEFQADVTLALPDNISARVRVHTQPHPRDTAPATRWVGTVVPLKPVAQP